MMIKISDSRKGGNEIYENFKSQTLYPVPAAAE